RPQADLHHPVDLRDQQDDAGPLGADQPAQPEDDPALVLAEDPDRRGEDVEYDDDGGDERDAELHGVIPPSASRPGQPAGATCRVRPSTLTMRPLAPSAIGPSSETARQISPRTKTWPSGAIGVRTTPVWPTSPSGPVVGLRSWARIPAETAKTKMP